MRLMNPFLASFQRLMTVLIASGVSVSELHADCSAPGDRTPIRTAAEFQSIAGALTAHYIQCNDLDFAGVNHVPIGTDTAPFSGQYDGGGYKIRNLTLSAAQSQLVSRQAFGLFGVVDGAIVSDLVIADAQILGGEMAETLGALAGTARNGAEFQSIEISAAVYQPADPLQRCTHTGILVGEALGGVVIEDLAVRGTAISNSGHVGGLIGRAVDATILDSEVVLSTIEVEPVFNLGFTWGLFCSGGLVGEGVNVIFNRTFFDGEVLATFGPGGFILRGSQAEAVAGGIIGCGSGALSALSSVRVEGSIVATGPFTAAGGLSGRYLGGSAGEGIVQRASMRGRVLRDSDQFVYPIGGLIGNGSFLSLEESAVSVCMKGTTAGGIIGVGSYVGIRDVVTRGRMEGVPGAGGSLGGVIAQLTTPSDDSLVGGLSFVSFGPSSSRGPILPFEINLNALRNMFFPESLLAVATNPQGTPIPDAELVGIPSMTSPLHNLSPSAWLFAPGLSPQLIDLWRGPYLLSDHNRDGIRGVEDIFLYLNGFFAGHWRADWNQDCVVTVEDIFGFLNDWFANN